MEKASKQLSLFSCSKNKDVENFIKNNALRFEKADKTRTYLIVPKYHSVDENENIKILAYFTLSVKTMKIPDGTSKTKVKKLDGFNKDAKELIVYLIGQLGKNEKYSKHIEGCEVLNYALHTIYKAYKIAGVRVVLVECQNEKKLMRFYTENGFEKIGSDLNTQLLQFIRTIITKEVIQPKEMAVNTEETVTRLE